MTEYKLIRTDYYVVYVEAKSKKEAVKKCEEGDEYLNGGDYSHSEFEFGG